MDLIIIMDMENNGFIENPTDAHRQNSSEVLF